MQRQWAMRPAGRKRRWPVTAIAFEALAWGLLISVLAGAAAGTVIFPVIYSIAGAIVGLAVGVVPTVFGTVWVVVIARRHRPLTSPNALHDDLMTLFVVLHRLLMATGAVVVGVWYYAIANEGSGDSYGGAVLFLAWVGVGPFIAASLVVPPLLRKAATTLTATFARHSGWDVTDARRVLPRGSPGPGDSQVGGPFGRVIPEGPP